MFFGIFTFDSFGAKSLSICSDQLGNKGHGFGYKVLDKLDAGFAKT